MLRRKLGLALLVVPAALLILTASPSTRAATPTPTLTPTPTAVVDPICAFTNGCVTPTPSPVVDPTPTARVLGTGTVSTPATGGGIPALAVVLPLMGLGLAAIGWARRRR